MSQQATMTRWQRFRQSDLVYYFLKDKVAMSCFVIFVLYVVLATLARWLRIIRMIPLPMTSWMQKCHHHGWKEEMLISC
jgi:hypothetical protein